MTKWCDAPLYERKGEKREGLLNIEVQNAQLFILFLSSTVDSIENKQDFQYLLVSYNSMPESRDSITNTVQTVKSFHATFHCSCFNLGERNYSKEALQYD